MGRLNPHLSSAVIYAPVLKGKLGEYRALGGLAPAIKQQILPIIDIPFVSAYKADGPTKTLDDHLRKVPAQLSRFWGKRQPIILDAFYLEEGEVMADGTHPMSWLIDSCRVSSVYAIPCTGPERPESLHLAARCASERWDTGACIRVPTLSATAEQMLDDLERVRVALGLAPEMCDLVLDARQVFYDDLPERTDELRSLLVALPMINRWRSLIVAASGFPENLADIPQNSDRLLPRTDLWIWRGLRDNVPRMPTFGDYAIAHADLVDVDGRKMNMSANIRYTRQEHWHVLKGRLVKRHGNAQFRRLCSNLIASGSFSGPDLSMGDRYIAECAAGGASPGNATKWREIGTSHHVTYVTQQIASSAAP